MNIYEFVSESPWLAFFLVWVILRYAYRIINRIFRHWNIRKHGYPPAHCDADGDFRPEDNEK